MRLKRCISSGMHTSAQYGWNYAFNKRMGTFLDAKKDEAPQNEYLNRFVVMGIWWLSFNLFKCVIYQVGTNGNINEKNPVINIWWWRRKKWTSGKLTSQPEVKLETLTIYGDRVITICRIKQNAFNFRQRRAFDFIFMVSVCAH